VGSFAVQLAKLAGARVTGHVSGPHRVDRVRTLGADEVVTSIDDSVAPLHFVLDGVGGQVLVDAAHRLVLGGTIVSYGLAGGKKAQLAFNDLREGRLIGFRVYGTDLQTFGADLEYMAGLV